MTNEDARCVGSGDADLRRLADRMEDVVERTETVMTQAHGFTVTELALRAQAGATRVGHLA